MIEVQHLTKRYGRVTAVDDVSFRVERGEILGFLGPNGAGKTTTMRILTGYMPATEGKAIVAGFDVFEQPIEAKRRTGYLPESPPLYLDMTVREYLAFVAKIKGVPSKERAGRLDHVMKRTYIADMAGRACGKLSKGYRQRVGLAQAILNSPPVLILDEPTVGLDPEHRELVWRILASERRERGTTILFSTHYLSEAEPAKRVVLLSRGRAVANDTPTALRAAVGAEVAEIEGPGAERLVRALRGLGATTAVLRTEQGYRVGIGGPREAVVELAGGAPGIERLALRPATLEDAYFARTRDGAA